MTLDEEIVLSCAVRYALGRRTYVVGSVCSELLRHEKELDWSTKQRISNEIQEYQDDYGQAGDDFDDKEWSYIKWLFDKRRRVTAEVNLYQTDDWVEVEAVWGEDDKLYTTDKGVIVYYHTHRNIKLKYNGISTRNT